MSCDGFGEHAAGSGRASRAGKQNVGRQRRLDPPDHVHGAHHHQEDGDGPEPLRVQFHVAVQQQQERQGEVNTISAAEVHHQNP